MSSSEPRSLPAVLESIDQEHRRNKIFRNVITGFLILFAIYVGALTNSNRHSISELKKNKASIASLQRTNCGLRSFLLKARTARLRTAQNEQGDAKQRDIAAAKSYDVILLIYTKDNCKPSKARKPRPASVH
jgi:hypothetical protein